MREGPDNEAAAVVEAPVFRARARSLHVPAVSQCKAPLHLLPWLSPTDVRQWRRCR